MHRRTFLASTAATTALALTPFARAAAQLPPAPPSPPQDAPLNDTNVLAAVGLPNNGGLVYGNEAKIPIR